MGKGNHSMTFLLSALFYYSTPSWLKVRGGSYDFSVIPSPNWTLDFFTALALGLRNGIIMISQTQNLCKSKSRLDLIVYNSSKYKNFRRAD